MALFFDQDWFDGKLRARNLTRADVARAMDRPVAEVEEIWKDQRELMPGDVATLATLLQVSPEEAADRAGIATPVPTTPTATMDDDMAIVLQRLDDMMARLGRLERTVLDIKALLLDARRDRRNDA